MPMWIRVYDDLDNGTMFIAWLWVVKADGAFWGGSASLREPGLGEIPAETERVARAVSGRHAGDAAA